MTTKVQCVLHVLTYGVYDSDMMSNLHDDFYKVGLNKQLFSIIHF